MEGSTATGYPAKGEDGELHSALAAVTAAPSGLAQDGTFESKGWGWADIWVTVAANAVEVTAYAYNVHSATWYVDTAFGTNGVFSFPVGTDRYSFEVRGSNQTHFRVTNVGGAGVITMHVTLTQE